MAINLKSFLLAPFLLHRFWRLFSTYLYTLRTPLIILLLGRKKRWKSRSTFIPLPLFTGKKQLLCRHVVLLFSLGGEHLGYKHTCRKSRTFEKIDSSYSRPYFFLSCCLFSKKGSKDIFLCYVNIYSFIFIKHIKVSIQKKVSLRTMEMNSQVPQKAVVPKVHI